MTWKSIGGEGAHPRIHFLSFCIFSVHISHCSCERGWGSSLTYSLCLSLAIINFFSLLVFGYGSQRRWYHLWAKVWGCLTALAAQVLHLREAGRPPIRGSLPLRDGCCPHFEWQELVFQTRITSLGSEHWAGEKDNENYSFCFCFWSHLHLLLIWGSGYFISFIKCNFLKINSVSLQPPPQFRDVCLSATSTFLCLLP